MNDLRDKIIVVLLLVAALITAHYTGMMIFFAGCLLAFGIIMIGILLEVS